MKKTIIISILVVGAITASLWLIKGRDTKDPEITEEIFEEELSPGIVKMFTIPEEYSWWTDLSFSPDNRDFVYSVSIGHQSVIFLNGEEYGSYDRVRHLDFTSDGGGLSYVATKDGKEFVVLNGEEQGRYETIDRLLFSPDGRSLAYRAVKDGKEFVVLNGEEQGRYETIDRLLFSPDGSRFAYIASEGDNSFVVIDGERKEDHVRITDIVFSPDGSRFAYLTVKDGRVMIVVDEREIDDRQYRIMTMPEFSPDGSRFAYLAVDDDTRQLVVMMNGVEKGKYEYVGELAFTENGILVYGASREGKNLLVLGEEEYEKDHRIGVVVPGPEGNIAYLAEGDEGRFLVLNGEEQDNYDFIWNRDIFFSPDGGRLAYKATKYTAIGWETDHIVLDGIAHRGFDHISENPIFSPDGRHLAYVAEIEYGGNSMVVLNGQRQESFSYIRGLRFSSDSRYVVYNAVTGRDLFMVVQDPYDQAEVSETDSVRGLIPAYPGSRNKSIPELEEEIQRLVSSSAVMTTYISKDDFNEIKDWYRSQLEGSGWRMMGWDDEVFFWSMGERGLVLILIELMEGEEDQELGLESGDVIIFFLEEDFEVIETIFGV